MFQVSQKFKTLKGELKVFNKETYLPQLRESLALEDQLRDIQRQLLESGSHGGIEEQESELFRRVQKAKLMEEKVERQKSECLGSIKGILTLLIPQKGKSEKKY